LISSITSDFNAEALTFESRGVFIVNVLNVASSDFAFTVNANTSVASPILIVLQVVDFFVTVNDPSVIDVSCQASDFKFVPITVNLAQIILFVSVFFTL
jgi:hypothetical protein